MTRPLTGRDDVSVGVEETTSDDQIGRQLRAHLRETIDEVMAMTADSGDGETTVIGDEAHDPGG